MIHKAADPPRYHGRCQNFHDKAPPHIRIHHIEEFILPRLIFYKFSPTIHIVHPDSPFSSKAPALNKPAFPFPPLSISHYSQKISTPASTASPATVIAITPIFPGFLTLKSSTNKNAITIIATL